MKLRTEVYETNGGLRIDTTRADAEHDALCAHALMQALDDCTDKIYNKHARKLIEQRAEDILAGWGFDSGEVE